MFFYSISPTYFYLNSTIWNDDVRWNYLVLVLRRPEKSSDGKFPLLVRISDNRQAILSQKLIQLPLWHFLIITLCILWIMKWNLKAAWSILRLVVINLRRRLVPLIFTILMIIMMTYVVNGCIRRNMAEFDSHLLYFDCLTRKLGFLRFDLGLEVSYEEMGYVFI